MALGANSYGSVAEVEALVKRFTASGSFTTATHPTLAHVEGFIDKVSGLVNVLLTELGFSIPISQADAKLALDLFVVEEAAALCEAANSAGRFFSEKGGETGTFKSIQEDIEAFIEAHAVGFERLGATRGRSVTYGLDYWDTDDAGDDIEPIFSRKMMGLEIIDWDTA